MKFYDELKKIMIGIAQVEGDAEILSILVREENHYDGNHYYCVKEVGEVEEDTEIMSILIKGGKHFYSVNGACEVTEINI